MEKRTLKEIATTTEKAIKYIRDNLAILLKKTKKEMNSQKSELDKSKLSKQKLELKSREIFKKCNKKYLNEYKELINKTSIDFNISKTHLLNVLGFSKHDKIYKLVLTNK